MSANWLQNDVSSTDDFDFETDTNSMPKDLNEVIYRLRTHIVLTEQLLCTLSTNQSNSNH